MSELEQVKKTEKGKLVLIPVTLGGDTHNAVIPSEAQAVATALRHFAVEEVKTARRFLRKLDREFPIDDCVFITIKKTTPDYELKEIIDLLEQGIYVGVMSEAGCPGIADPGANIVALAHEHKIRIVPLTGPSSIFMALMASGMNGQTFAFSGYIPKDKKERIKKLRELEATARRTKQTQIFMDTPFRNNHVLEDMLNELMDDTPLCIASQITLKDEEDIRTMTVEAWRDHAYDLSKRPTIFVIGIPKLRD